MSIDVVITEAKDYIDGPVDMIRIGCRMVLDVNGLEVSVKQGPEITRYEWDTESSHYEFIEWVPQDIALFVEHEWFQENEWTPEMKECVELFLQFRDSEIDKRRKKIEAAKNELYVHRQSLIERLAGR